MSLKSKERRVPAAQSVAVPVQAPNVPLILEGHVPPAATAAQMPSLVVPGELNGHVLPTSIVGLLEPRERLTAIVAKSGVDRRKRGPSQHTTVLDRRLAGLLAVSPNAHGSLRHGCLFRRTTRITGRRPKRQPYRATLSAAPVHALVRCLFGIRLPNYKVNWRSDQTPEYEGVSSR